MKTLGSLSVLATAAAIAVYVVMTRTGIEPGIKWTLFGLHLFLIALGLVLGTSALIRRQWVGAISIAPCLYCLWLQLVT